MGITPACYPPRDGVTYVCYKINKHMSFPYEFVNRPLTEYSTGEADNIADSLEESLEEAIEEGDDLKASYVQDAIENYDYNRN